MEYIFAIVILLVVVLFVGTFIGEVFLKEKRPVITEEMKDKMVSMYETVVNEPKEIRKEMCGEIANKFGVRENAVVAILVRRDVYIRTGKRVEDLVNRDRNRKETSHLQDTKECPMCVEMVKMKAKICRFCNYKFE